MANLLDLYSGNLTSHHSTLLSELSAACICTKSPHLHHLPCTRSFICRSGLLWGMVTQTQHSHLPMDTFDTLDPSLYHNPSTTPDEVRKVTTMLPPGAASTYTTPSIFHLRVGSGLPFLPPTWHYSDTNRVHTPFSTNSPSDGSEMSPYDPSTSAHDSTSPTPRAPHAHNSCRNVPRRS